MMEHGWLTDIIRYMIFLTYFDLDELINDYEVTTVGGLVMTELSHPKQGEKIDLEEISARSD
jgi:Mg2+/Co2+ transporter CorC